MSKLEQAFRQLVELRQQLEYGGIAVNVRTFGIKMGEALDNLSDGIHEKSEAEETPIPTVFSVRAEVWVRAFIAFASIEGVSDAREHADSLLTAFDNRFPEYKSVP